MTEDEMAGWHHRLDGHEFEPRAAFPSACLAAQTKRWAEGIRVPAPLAGRWVWRNGRGPHLEGRQAPQASSALESNPVSSLQAPEDV